MKERMVGRSDGWMDGWMDEVGDRAVSIVEGSGPADSERSIRVVCTTVQYSGFMLFLDLS